MNYFGVLHNAEQGWVVLDRAWKTVKPWLIAGHKFEISIKPQRRNSEQNAKFHALCSDLERSGVQWAGKPRDAAEWKVLLVSGHSVATKQGSDIVPGLEGEFVSLRESTALMSKARSSSLIEYAVAFCAMHGVQTGA
jgi:hypothetical protein